MYSTPKTRGGNAMRCAASRLALAITAGLASLGGVVGCQTNPPAKAEPYSTATIPADEAMARRNWDRSYAEFESGATLAGATRFPYAPQTVGDGVAYATLGPERSNALMDNLFFVGQTLWLPFTYFGEPPFVKKEYRGVLYEPTHYAMPVLPPDEVPDYDAYSPPPLKDEEAELRAAERRDAIAPADPSAPPRLRDQIRPEPADESMPAPVEAPTITPEGSTPAPGEPGETVKIEPEATPDATPAPEVTPEATEPAPAPADVAPEAAPAPAPEATEPAPAEAPVPDAAPAPEATEAAPAPEPDAATSAPEATAPAAEPAPEPAAEQPEPAPADENK